MRAVVYAAPGELIVEDRPRPEPGPGEVLIRVGWVGICGSDLLLWSGGFARVAPPIVVGHEFCGVIEDANGAAGCSEGDRVVVEPLISCGECATCRAGLYHVCERLGVIGIDTDGAAATFVTVPAERLHAIPDEMTLRDAALVEPTAVAVHMTRRAGLVPGDRVFIAGSGPIGTLAALVSRAIGASRVLVSEVNPQRREQAAALGFETIDPTEPGAVAELANAFDVGFELTGVEAAAAAVIRALRPRGTMLLGGIPHDPVRLPIADAVLKELELRGSRVYRSEDFAEAIRLIAEGHVVPSALVTRVVPIADAVEGAYTRIRDSRSDLKVLIRPEEGAE